ncbi:hypothetical protein BKA67DRAFT_518867 [Truncatella angustata]|uniref:DUF6604 domain-containing protein n=1 Tax=Truncatella angustata TaxID=152316 RepID=A0A9P8ZVI8_9PEZI|nr:uncharacterized protein BKA67DRAFT_518867 [Truncatella angustata]KAH6652650.1 hypothetical protein BKA67DRAFT_518867 [Truncatella angustata]
MLPDPLVGVYQQYKQDTDSIAAWLASTAAANGYSRDLFLASGGRQHFASGRPKGKARKNAKKAGATATKPQGNNHSTCKYRIAIKEFTALSEYVASKNVSVPSSFASTLDRLIKVRGTFGDQLAEHGDAPNTAAQARHSFFVGVLEKVKEVLKPRVQGSPKGDKASASTEEVSNRFAGLSVYEPSEEFLNAPELERPKQPSNDSTVYEAEPMTSYEDVMYAVGFMVNDLNKIRSRIDWIWSNYKTGIFDLAAAAVATNTAIDLARKIIEDVMPLTEAHGGAWKILNRFYQVQAMLKGWKFEDLFTSNIPGDNFNYDSYQIGVDTFMLAYRLVDAFAKVLQPGQLPLYKDGMFGWYDPNSDREAKSGYQKLEEDRALMMPFFTELMTVVRGVGDYPIKDEFIRGMEELDRTDKVPFYLVFAAQVFVDIHYVLRGQAIDAFKTLESHATFMANDIKEHLEFHKDLKISNWPKENDRFMILAQTRINYILADPVYKAKDKTYRKMGMTMPTTIERNRILKMSPLLSGLILYRFRSEQRDLGLTVANAWGSVTYTAHLQNALQQEKLLSEQWDDMMMVRVLLGDSNFFVGDAPTNPPDYMKRFNLQTGVSVAAMTGTLPGIKYDDLAPVSSMFHERYVTETGRVDWTAEHIDQIIDLSRYEAMGSEEEGTLMFGQIEDPDKLNDKKKTGDRSGKNRKKATEGALLQPEQLIRLLTFALNNEKFELSFPWLSMHRSCWRFLRAVKTSCDSYLRQTVGPAYVEKESQLPFLVAWIFSALDHRDAQLMLLAADAARGFYQRSGRNILKSLEKLGMPIQFTTEEEFETMQKD